MRPIGFSGGLTGSLFREFAFTLAGAVLISGCGCADAVAHDVFDGCCHGGRRRRDWRAGWTQRFESLRRGLRWAFCIGRSMRCLLR